VEQVVSRLDAKSLSSKADLMVVMVEKVEMFTLE
jgi:hypothetical protein